MKFITFYSSSESNNNNVGESTKANYRLLKKLIFITIALVFVKGNLIAQVFTKITEGSVVNDNRYSEGASWGDINNDDHLDLFVGNMLVNEPNLLFLNSGDETFTQVLTGNVVSDISTSSGGCFADFNNDGYLDLFVQNHYGYNNFLYLNNGDETFTKITSGNIVNDGGNSFNSSVADYDNDGNLDIFVSNGAFTNNGETNALYKGNGDSTFFKITTGDLVTGLSRSLCSSWCDYDNDGDLDLFVANSDPFNGIGINNFLYRNNGNGTFISISSGVLVNDSSVSTGGSWGDYDNDGDFDLFVTNWAGENNSLYQNNGNGTFTIITIGDIVNDGGHSVGSSWGDYDNDGDLDLFVTNDLNQNNYFYENNCDGTFSKITTGVHVNDGGRSNGVSWADYDNDGDLDIFVPNGSNPSQSNFLYRNDGIFNNNWINIKCVGVVTNTTAIGTKVKARAIINGLPVWQFREISGQTGFNAQNSFNVEFGLGDAMTIDSLKIEWSSGTIAIYTNVAPNVFYTATEGQGLVVTSIKDKSVAVPNEFKLSQNFPNPFNPNTTIEYTLPTAEKVKIDVFNLLGQKIETLINKQIPAGSHEIEFKALDLPSGIYLYRIKAGDFQQVKKMFLIK